MKNVLWMLLAAAVFSVTACSKSNTRDGATSTNSSTAGQSSSATGVNGDASNNGASRSGAVYTFVQTRPLN